MRPACLICLMILSVCSARADSHQLDLICSESDISRILLERANETADVKLTAWNGDDKIHEKFHEVSFEPRPGPLPIELSTIMEIKHSYGNLIFQNAYVRISKLEANFVKELKALTAKGSLTVQAVKTETVRVRAIYIYFAGKATIGDYATEEEDEQLICIPLF